MMKSQRNNSFRWLVHYQHGLTEEFRSRICRCPVEANLIETRFYYGLTKAKSGGEKEEDGCLIPTKVIQKNQMVDMRKE